MSVVTHDTPSHSVTDPNFRRHSGKQHTVAGQWANYLTLIASVHTLIQKTMGSGH